MHAVPWTASAQTGRARLEHVLHETIGLLTRILPKSQRQHCAVQGEQDLTSPFARHWARVNTESPTRMLYEDVSESWQRGAQAHTATITLYRPLAHASTMHDAAGV